MLQPLQWCCLNCVIHHEWVVREEQKYICVARATNNTRDVDAWSLLLLAATVRSFAHMPLEISDHNKIVLWPGCGGRAEFSLHTKNVQSVWLVITRGCCCSLSSGVALIVWFTTNGMCAKNKNIYAWHEQAIIRDCNAWSLLLLAAAVRSFAHMPLGISDRNTWIQRSLTTTENKEASSQGHVAKWSKITT